MKTRSRKSKTKPKTKKLVKKIPKTKSRALAKKVTLSDCEALAKQIWPNAYFTIDKSPDQLRATAHNGVGDGTYFAIVYREKSAKLVAQVMYAALKALSKQVRK